MRLHGASENAPDTGLTVRRRGEEGSMGDQRPARAERPAVTPVGQFRIDDEVAGAGLAVSVVGYIAVAVLLGALLS